MGHCILLQVLLKDCFLLSLAAFHSRRVSVRYKFLLSTADVTMAHADNVTTTESESDECSWEKDISSSEVHPDVRSAGSVGCSCNTSATAGSTEEVLTIRTPMFLLLLTKQSATMESLLELKAVVQETRQELQTAMRILQEIRNQRSKVKVKVFVLKHHRGLRLLRAAARAQRRSQRLSREG